MTTVHSDLAGDKAVLRRDDGISSGGIARLAEEGAAFDFWNERGEEIYSGEDGEAI